VHDRNRKRKALPNAERKLQGLLVEIIFKPEVRDQLGKTGRGLAKISPLSMVKLTRSTAVKSPVENEHFRFVHDRNRKRKALPNVLTGLLAPSEGEALLFGQPLDASDSNARRRVGYMSQSFSLYTELTVRQNLELHARLFHLPPHTSRPRASIRWRAIISGSC
jgi:hypothetical protein